MGKWFDPDEHLPKLTRESGRQYSQEVIVRTTTGEFKIDRLIRTHNGVEFHGETFGLYKVEKWAKIPKDEQEDT